jgi:hypothetical protein
MIFLKIVEFELKFPNNFGSALFKYSVSFNKCVFFL